MKTNSTNDEKHNQQVIMLKMKFFEVSRIFQMCALKFQKKFNREV